MANVNCLGQVFDTHWSYDDTAHDGPSHWGDLDPKWATCGVGQAQSPLAIEGAQKVLRKAPQIGWQTVAPCTFTDNGHTIFCTPGSFLGVTNIDGEVYELQQMHFHTPAEHRLNGVNGEAELHFVHKNVETGNYAVIAVLLVSGSGKADPRWDKFIEGCVEAKRSGAPVTHDVSWTALVPNVAPSTTRYGGSLTTPGCDEPIYWIVCNDVMTLTKDQMDKLRGVYSGNARPLQRANGRVFTADIGGR